MLCCVVICCGVFDVVYLMWCVALWCVALWCGLAWFGVVCCVFDVVCCVVVRCVVFATCYIPPCCSKLRDMCSCSHNLFPTKKSAHMTSKVKIGAVFESKETLQATLLQQATSTSTTKDFRVAKNNTRSTLRFVIPTKEQKGGKKSLLLVSGSYMPNPTVKATRMAFGL